MLIKISISVDNHNRRQEETECWVKHQNNSLVMQQDERKRSYRFDNHSHPASRKISRSQEHLKSREYWAQKKESKRQRLERHSENSGSSDDSRTSSVVKELGKRMTESKIEERRRPRKKAKKKKEKSSKKKKSKRRLHDQKK